MKLLLSTLSLLVLTTGCTFHSTASQWNERVGPNGTPVFVKSSSSVGLNLLVLLKIVGATDLSGLVDNVTAEIAEEEGDRVRIIQSESENYWYGFPPLTWILTPVVTTVAVEYEPTPEAIAAARQQQAGQQQATRQEAE